MSRNRYIAFVFMIFLSACSTSKLKTDVPFHELAIDPAKRENAEKDLNLPFNAYVVGVEKDNRSRVGEIKECSQSQSVDCLNINNKYYEENTEMQKNLRGKYIHQHRPLFISHIAKFSGDGSIPCFLYNAYAYGAPCNSSEISSQMPPKGGHVQYGWKLMQELHDDIGENVKTHKINHVLVYFMGWNTPQWEAMKNFRDLYDNLMLASQNDPEFKPLFVGVTWPSTGNPTIANIDFGIKAKDADEVGAIWGNILINQVLADLKSRHGFKVIVVGHSFGARASSRAVFSAPLLNSEMKKNVDLLLGLQGAYSYQRYVFGVDAEKSPDGKEGAPYKDYAKMAGAVALTSSKYDEAVKLAGHAPYFVGSQEVFAKTSQSKYLNIFAHKVADAAGVKDLGACDGSKVMYIDASDIINKNQPGTGGFAHSYIFTPDIGRLTYQLITSCIH